MRGDKVGREGDKKNKQNFREKERGQKEHAKEEDGRKLLTTALNDIFISSYNVTHTIQHTQTFQKQ